MPPNNPSHSLFPLTKNERLQHGYMSSRAGNVNIALAVYECVRKEMVKGIEENVREKLMVLRLVGVVW